MIQAYQENRYIQYPFEYLNVSSDILKSRFFEGWSHIDEYIKLVLLVCQNSAKEISMNSVDETQLYW